MKKEVMKKKARDLLSLIKMSFAESFVTHMHKLIYIYIKKYIYTSEVLI